jgi:L-lactate dehydrogenase
MSPVSVRRIPDLLLDTSGWGGIRSGDDETSPCPGDDRPDAGEIYAGVVAEVAIVGAGRVGVACAGSVLRQGLASRLVFYDRNADRALGEALDFQDAAPLLPDCAVEGRPLTEASPTDIAVITAGAPPEPGASRMTIIDHNLDVAAELADALAGALPRVAIVISNPVDVLTEFFTRAWAPRGVNVFGTGTALDSWRLRQLLARELGVHPGSVHAWVIGEHGLSAVFPFSLARVGPFPLREYAAGNGVSIDTAALAEEVRRAGPHVHELKGSTSSAIALTAARLAAHVIREHGAIVPVSVRVEEGLCASLPAKLGPDGAGPAMLPELEDAELEAWEESLTVLRDATARIAS